MLLRSIPIDYAQRPLTQVDATLDALEHAHHATILLAIESGSRAWGFPSPDSDYDCRFIYARRLNDYLSPWTPRDVIEMPLVDDMDVHGWDLGKALKLMLKGNAVIIEWLTSPIVYRGDARFRSELLALTETHTSRAAIAKHYLHLGLRQWSSYFADGKDIAFKKIFYALRPAAALRWMRLHPASQFPPMHFPTLFDQCDPPAPIIPLVTELLARKALTNELGSGRLAEPIRMFISAEFETANLMVEQSLVIVSSEARAEASALYARWVTNSAV